MKKHQYALRFWFSIGALFAAAVPSWADVIVKADNADPLNLPTSWTNGVAPGSGDVAAWDSALANRTYTLGADLSWLGLAITTDPGGNLAFSSGNLLTLGSEGMTTTPNRTITLSNGMALNADQTWKISSGILIPQGGLALNGHTLTLSGGATKQFKAMITGPGDIITTQGTLNLSGTGSLASDADLVFKDAGSLSVDKDVVSSTQRVLSKSMTFFDGRAATIRGSSKAHVAMTNQNELALGRGGQSRISVSQQGYHATLWSGSLAFAPDSGNFLFTGNQLGLFPETEPSNYANVLFGTAPALARTTGATGPTTLGVLRGATANYDSSEYGLGLVTYDETNGVRLLDFGTEYTTAIVDGENAGNNVRLANVGGIVDHFEYITNIVEEIEVVTTNFIAGSMILTNHLTAPLTVVNSLSLDVTGPHGNAGILLSGDEDAVLRLDSGILFARESGVSSKEDDATDRNEINLPLDFNGKQGFILNARTDGMSNGNGPALSFNVSPTNDNSQGIVFAGSGSAYLQWPAPTVFTGPVIINSGWFRITGSGNESVIPTKLLMYGGSVQNHGNRIADSADIEIHGGSLLVRSGDTNSGNSGNDNFRDLTITGGSFTQGGDGGGTCIMRSATLLGGTLSLYRSTLTTVTNDMTVAGCRISLYSNNNKDRSGTRLVVVGALTVSNTVDQTPYVPFNMGFSWYRNPAFVSVTNTFSVIGNAVNTNAVAITRDYSTDPKTMLAEIRLNDEVECFVTDGAADIDFDVDANFADNGTVVGKLVKTGAGTLRMTAITNALTGGINVSEGRLILDGGASSDVAVATGATLAGDGLIDADLTFADGATYEVKIFDETTAAVLDVAGTVTGSGEVVVPVAQNQADGEWLVMTADSFDAEFVSTNPRWALYPRNGGTELWLTKKLGTLIVVR